MNGLLGNVLPSTSRKNGGSFRARHKDCRISSVVALMEYWSSNTTGFQGKVGSNPAQSISFLRFTQMFDIYGIGFSLKQFFHERVLNKRRQIALKLI